MYLELGSNIVNSYKRLPYKAWYALAEFVDNSTQSYFNNRLDLDEAYQRHNEKLTVRIAYDSQLLRVVDNAMGMSYDELQHALRIGEPPSNPDGRSKYGLGLKTAAFWMGDEWDLRTKRLGETREHKITVTLEKIAAGDHDVEYEYTDGLDLNDHYTILEIRKHNQKFAGRTIGKIKDYLRSMYRQDLRNNLLNLEWRGEILKWEEAKLLQQEDGSYFYKEFNFTVDGKQLEGWVGILERGSRAEAGFSILQHGRVIRGWPNAWRPQILYGQEGGSNNLVNQRLVGEMNVRGFDVSHTKDDILWIGDQEEQVEKELERHCGDFARFAQEYRKGNNDSRGPSEAATTTAIDELKRELESPEMIDRIVLSELPDEEEVKQSFEFTSERVLAVREETFRVKIGNLNVAVYVNEDMSPLDPYVLSNPTEDIVPVIINTAHPHWKSLNNNEVLNYLRHCVYDAVAEWKARKKTSQLLPNTIKKLKDELLRVSFEMEQGNGYSEENNETYYEENNNLTLF